MKCHLKVIQKLFKSYLKVIQKSIKKIQVEKIQVEKISLKTKLLNYLNSEIKTLLTQKLTPVLTIPCPFSSKV